MRTQLVLACTLSFAGCAESDPATGGTGELENPDPHVTFVGSAELGSPLCGDGEVVFVARKVGCWEPELPCTLPQNPIDIEGEPVDCSAGGSATVEVEVDARGKYDVQAVGPDGELCYGRGLVAPIPVGNAELDAREQMDLSVLDGDPCPGIEP